MLFSSTMFLFLFLPMLICLYYTPLFRRIEMKNALLLIASFVFYSFGEPVFVFLLFISIVITGYFGKVIEINKRKIYLILILGYHITLLFVFKYLSFLCAQIGHLFGKDILISIELPIGISFFTFQLMSYIFDVYFGKVKAQKSILSLGLYVSFFPQLVAGPIVRYIDFEEQIVNRVERKEDLVVGVRRFAYGLAKKLLIADYVSLIADYAWENIGAMSVGMAWLGALAYSLQIYYDFSGYSDMAIGLGRIFGFKFNENFNYPYVSKSITDFWRRWHISLSSWFRDYVYIPLGGNRVNRVRWVLNLFIVWLLTGVWHGANWTFILWGLIYFAFLLLEKLTDIDKKMGVVSYLWTTLIVMLNWVIFRSDSIVQAMQYIANMFGVNNECRFIDVMFLYMLKNTALLLVFAVIGVTPIVRKCFDNLESKRFFLGGCIEDIWVMLIWGTALINAISATYKPFLYFNF